MQAPSASEARRIAHKIITELPRPLLVLVEAGPHPGIFLTLQS